MSNPTPEIVPSEGLTSRETSTSSRPNTPPNVSPDYRLVSEDLLISLIPADGWFVIQRRGYVIPVAAWGLFEVVSTRERYVRGMVTQPATFDLIPVDIASPEFVEYVRRGRGR